MDEAECNAALSSGSNDPLTCLTQRYPVAKSKETNRGLYYQDKHALRHALQPPHLHHHLH